MFVDLLRRYLERLPRISEAGSPGCAIATSVACSA
jgi:hypothetical protein